MKIKTIFAFALSISLFIVSCEKETDDASTTTTTSSTSSTTSTTGTTTSPSFSYKVDGNSFTIDSSAATLYTSSLTGKRAIDIYAYKSGTMVFELHFLPKTGTQTVSQNLNDAWLTYIAGSTYEDQYNCVSGNFNLTSCDTINNKIEGTFDFVGNNYNSASKSISEGKIFVTSITKQ